jgi:hypothetical protein
MANTVKIPTLKGAKRGIEEGPVSPKPGLIVCPEDIETELPEPATCDLDPSN